jgi:hypothetical protein
MSLTVGGAGSPKWADREWPTSSTSPAVDRVNSIQKAVDDARSLGPLANGTARRTSSTAALTQQDFEVATRLGPSGVMARSLDQVVNAPNADRNPWSPVADRRSVNPYDHIMDALRTSALKRDAALAGSSATAATTDAAAGEPPASEPALAYAPLTPNQYGEAYVRNAIAAYERNSGLHSSPAPTSAPTPTPAPVDPGAAEDGSPARKAPPPDDPDDLS